VGRLDAVDLSARLPREQGATELAAAQQRLMHLRLLLAGLIGPGQIGPPLLVLFEGWDASGKGGAIKRLVGPLDPRHVRVVQFAAPTYDEQRHHFLWRFWPALPGWGGMAVLDRSWYGRVLVERVEEFATEAAWERAYREIVDLETTLNAEGTILVKFFLHLSPAEQLRRFQARAQDPYRGWKLTSEDWRNRDRRPAYEAAVEEMLRRTESPAAAWHLVAAEDKRWARVAVVRTVCSEIEAALTARGIDPDPHDLTRAHRVPHRPPRRRHARPSPRRRGRPRRARPGGRRRRAAAAARSG
jgi:polyphosphate kinase 2 (PPK2 family)